MTFYYFGRHFVWVLVLSPYSYFDRIPHFEPRLRFLPEVQTALKLSQEDQATIQSLKKEIERAWKMVAKGLHITHTISDLLIFVVMFF